MFRNIIGFGFFLFFASGSAFAQDKVGIDCVYQSMTKENHALVKADLDYETSAAAPDSPNNPYRPKAMQMLNGYAKSCSSKGGWSNRQMTASVLYSSSVSILEHSVPTLTSAGLPEDFVQRIVARMTPTQKRDLFKNQNMGMQIFTIANDEASKDGITFMSIANREIGVAIGKAVTAEVMRQDSEMAFRDPAYDSILLGK